MCHKLVTDGYNDLAKISFVYNVVCSGGNAVANIKLAFYG